MRASLLFPAAALFGAALAQLDYALLTKFPSCAVGCSWLLSVSDIVDKIPRYNVLQL